MLLNSMPLIICQFCDKTYKNLQVLSRHLKTHKISYKEYYDQFLKTQNDGLCPVCQKPTNWNICKYYKHCSTTCSSNDPKTIEKNKLTNLQIYGTNYPIQNKDILAKRIVNNIKKYGVGSYTQTTEYAEQYKQTCLEKYGVENLSFLNDTKEKISTVLHNKAYIKYCHLKTVSPLFNIEDYKGNNVEYLWKCLKCQNQFIFNIKDGKMPLCPKCYPKFDGRSQIQNNLQIFLTHYVNIQPNKKNLIKDGEIDIFVPDKNIAIELNGNYWHSEINGNKDKKYHLNKTLKCEEKNIKLIHIFEDEWVYKSQIVKSHLKHILDLIQRTIPAHKCLVKKIDDTIKDKFINKYHIQGEDKSTINLGLYNRNRLIAVMTFRQIHKKDSWELSRYATISSFNIVGGADKLLKHFECAYNPLKLITYVDRRWNQGNLHNQLGFKLDNIRPPNYWYIKKPSYIHRIHRFNFRKSVLKDKLKIFDSNLTEWENMQLNGYDRIWDCGNLVFTKDYKIVC